ncbi:MAG: hypothetical protein U0528_07800 [Anaerolineae bacterium]|nr:hypothetical protein [Anaerolineae bacterium]
MVRKLRTLAIIIALFAALFSKSAAPVQAAEGDFVRVSYIGGALCTTFAITIPVHITSNFAAPAPFTEVININGVAVASFGGTQGAGLLDYDGDLGVVGYPPQSFPYTYQIVATWGQFVVTANGVCYSDYSEPLVSIADSIAEGRGVPAGFELRWLSCSSAVFDAPGGTALATGEAVWAGQSWFVNPKPVKDASGKSWTEIFASGTINGYIPTSCIK